MISEILDGLDILRAVNPDAPVVAHAYIITVPKILQADLSGPQQTSIEAAGGVLHPVYGSYYYPAETITELGNVTGPSEDAMPPLPLVIPPPPLPIP